ncbi:hypothetical protein HDU76_006788 [Blyttiomyces sp. JEL0837]|nr:hypothetical protein HDU76_006788 [Blyttiomyces sp. JEL0837]
MKLQATESLVRFVKSLSGGASSVAPSPGREERIVSGGERDEILQAAAMFGIEKDLELGVEFVAGIVRSVSKMNRGWAVLKLYVTVCKEFGDAVGCDFAFMLSGSDRVKVKDKIRGSVRHVYSNAVARHMDKTPFDFDDPTATWDQGSLCKVVESTVFETVLSVFARLLRGSSTTGTHTSTTARGNANNDSHNSNGNNAPISGRKIRVILHAIIAPVLQRPNIRQEVVDLIFSEYLTLLTRGASRLILSKSMDALRTCLESGCSLSTEDGVFLYSVFVLDLVVCLAGSGGNGGGGREREKIMGVVGEGCVFRSVHFRLQQQQQQQLQQYDQQQQGKAAYFWGIKVGGFDKALFRSVVSGIVLPFLEGVQGTDGIIDEFGEVTVRQLQCLRDVVMCVL